MSLGQNGQYGHYSLGETESIDSVRTNEFSKILSEGHHVQRETD